MSASAHTDWFWSDWSGDPAVRRLSPAARGVWIDLLALASAGIPTGYVTDRKGRPIPLDEIARFTNCPIQELPNLIGEIVEKGAGSRDRTGRLFNRRMARDATLSTKRAKAGRAGQKALKYNGTRVLPHKNTGQNQERSGVDPPPIVQTKIEEPSAARASGCQITPAAFTLSDRLCEAMRWDLDDPRRVGSAWLAQKWLNGGWNADLCASTVAQIAARKTVETLTYFEKAIASAHTQPADPVPVAKVQPQETVHAAPRQSGTGSYGAALDNGRAAHAELREYIARRKAAENAGGGGGGQIVDLMPDRRRG